MFASRDGGGATAGAESAVVCWSGGKDAALALEEIRRGGALRVDALLTTYSAEFDRVSMHGVRRALHRAQAGAVGLPLEEVFVGTPPAAESCGIRRARPNGFASLAPNDEYERRMDEAYARIRGRGISTVVFGDIHLEDLRAYRDGHLARHGLSGAYPLWKRDTRSVAREAIARGFRAVVVCVDGEKLSASFCGREFDARFLDGLPAGVDPCGENGEFHTFVYDGPVLERAVRFRRGQVVTRGRWHFADLLPVPAPEPAAAGPVGTGSAAS